MRSRLVLVAAALLFTQASLGCSEDNAVTAEEVRGSDDDLRDERATPPEATATAEAPPAAGESAGSSEPAPGSKIEPANGMPGAPTNPDGMKPPEETKPPGETKPPPPPPAMKCANDVGVREVEGNDSPETATSLDGSYVFCGAFSGEADADHFTFVMPADATDFAWEAQATAGTYTFTISSEGVTAGENDNAPWFPGKKYMIRLKNTTAADYVFKLKIKRGN
jgi:hypothetical protein